MIQKVVKAICMNIKAEVMGEGLIRKRLDEKDKISLLGRQARVRQSNHRIQKFILNALVKFKKKPLDSVIKISINDPLKQKSVISFLHKTLK